MKYVWRLAFLGVILSPLAARAEVTVVKKQTAEMRAFENFDQKIEDLESYSVVYFEGGKKTYIVMKSAPARQTKPNEVTVQLLPAKKS